MSGNNDENAARRFLVMGCCSVLLHVIIAAIIILPGIGSEKSARVYNVEVKYLQTKMEQPDEIEQTAIAPELPVSEEAPSEPEKPEVIDLTGIVEPVSPEIAEWLEEDVIETPVPLVENPIITPDGGLGSGEDTEDGGGNSLLASGTGSGWGGDASGEGWGGGSGSPGSGGGTGGGLGSGAGNSRKPTGDTKTGVYIAGMPGITPPVTDRAPQPAYPAASRKRGEQGVVLLKIEVLTNGRVGQAEVEKSSGYALLDEAALATVERWRFKPAMKGRETVICWVNIPIRFTLN